VLVATGTSNGVIVAPATAQLRRVRTNARTNGKAKIMPAVARISM
jgi:hypothetical protein